MFNLKPAQQEKVENVFLGMLSWRSWSKVRMSDRNTMDTLSFCQEETRSSYFLSWSPSLFEEKTIWMSTNTKCCSWGMCPTYMTTVSLSQNGAQKLSHEDQKLENKWNKICVEHEIRLPIRKYYTNNGFLSLTRGKENWQPNTVNLTKTQSTGKKLASSEYCQIKSITKHQKEMLKKQAVVMLST